MPVAVSTAIIRLFRGATGLTDLPIDTRFPRGEQERSGLAKANRPGRLYLELCVRTVPLGRHGSALGCERTVLRCRQAAKANGSYPFIRRFESAHRTERGIFLPAWEGEMQSRSSRGEQTADNRSIQVRVLAGLWVWRNPMHSMEGDRSAPEPVSKTGAPLIRREVRCLLLPWFRMVNVYGLHGLFGRQFAPARAWCSSHPPSSRIRLRTRLANGARCNRDDWRFDSVRGLLIKIGWSVSLTRFSP